MRNAITVFFFSATILSHAVSASAADVCDSLRSKLGSDTRVRCSLNSFTLRTSSGTMVGVDCDDPGSGREFGAGAAPAQLLASLETIKLQAMFQGERENAPIALLTVTDRATLGSVQSLAARRLCQPGEKGLSCDDLSEKLQALDVLQKATQGLPATSFDEIKKGQLGGKALGGIFITFGLRLSELTSCRFE